MESERVVEKQKKMTEWAQPTSTNLMEVNIYFNIGNIYKVDNSIVGRGISIVWELMWVEIAKKGERMSEKQESSSLCITVMKALLKNSFCHCLVTVIQLMLGMVSEPKCGSRSVSKMVNLVSDGSKFLVDGSKFLVLLCHFARVHQELEASLPVYSNGLLKHVLHHI